MLGRSAASASLAAKQVPHGRQSGLSLLWCSLKKKQHSNRPDVELRKHSLIVAGAGPDTARLRRSVQAAPPHAAGMGQADAGAAAGDAGPGPGSFALAQTLRGHTRAVSGVAFRPEGDRLLASCSADASLAIWDVHAGKQVTPKAAGGGSGGMTHPQGINCVAWDPRGRYLASGSDDQTARLWDAETGACLRTLPGHTNYVFCCQFDPVGHILVRGRGATAGCAHGACHRRQQNHGAAAAPHLAEPRMMGASLHLPLTHVPPSRPSATRARKLARTHARRPRAASTRRCASGTCGVGAACVRSPPTATP